MLTSLAFAIVAHEQIAPATASVVRLGKRLIGDSPVNVEEAPVIGCRPRTARSNFQRFQQLRSRSFLQEINRLEHFQRHPVWNESKLPPCRLMPLANPIADVSAAGSHPVAAERHSGARLAARFEAQGR